MRESDFKGVVVTVDEAGRVEAVGYAVGGSGTLQALVGPLKEEEGREVLPFESWLTMKKYLGEKCPDCPLPWPYREEEEEGFAAPSPFRGGGTTLHFERYTPPPPPSEEALRQLEELRRELDPRSTVGEVMELLAERPELMKHVTELRWEEFHYEGPKGNLSIDALRVELELGERKVTLEANTTVEGLTMDNRVRLSEPKRELELG